MRGTPYLRDDARPATALDEVFRRLGEAKTFWLATSREGTPHVMPLLAVSFDGRTYFCAGQGTRKARNLASDPRCVLTTAADGMDIVIEGTAVRVDDPGTLRRAADTYLAKYGWDAQPRDGAFHGDGAPTAGPPPLYLYEVRPSTIFSFGTDDAHNAMRWTIDR
jgi:nitroimidazol reductase NimA-like FMN-containing flavoprotein (pyridoxamine 5'-phosphate oxidase superfamily)